MSMGHVETLLPITIRYVTSCGIKLYQKLCPSIIQDLILQIELLWRCGLQVLNNLSAH